MTRHKKATKSFVKNQYLKESLEQSWLDTGGEWIWNGQKDVYNVFQHSNHKSGNEHFQLFFYRFTDYEFQWKRISEYFESNLRNLNANHIWVEFRWNLSLRKQLIPRNFVNFDTKNYLITNESLTSWNHHQIRWPVDFPCKPHQTALPNTRKNACSFALSVVPLFCKSFSIEVRT